MNVGDILTLALGLGVGGAVGAVLAVLAAGSKVASGWQAFAFAFREYTIGRTDPATTNLIGAFEAINDSLSALSASIQKLRRALRLR